MSQHNSSVSLALRKTRASSRNVGKFTEQLTCPQRIFVSFMQIASENYITWQLLYIYIIICKTAGMPNSSHDLALLRSESPPPPPKSHTQSHSPSKLKRWLYLRLPNHLAHVTNLPPCMYPNSGYTPGSSSKEVNTNAH